MNEERTGKCLRQVEHIHGHVTQIFHNCQPINNDFIYIYSQTCLSDPPLYNDFLCYPTLFIPPQRFPVHSTFI
jgi:hypothetical protein